MSFLLGRTGRREQPSSSLLYDSSREDGDGAEDDELEAAFGDSDARELDNRADYRADHNSGQSSRQQQQPQQQQGVGGAAVAGSIPLNAYRPEGYHPQHHHHGGDESINVGDDSENDYLLDGSSSSAAAAGGSRSHSPRPRLTTQDTSNSRTSISTSHVAGGYDFEADPYERRSAPIALTADDEDDDDNDDRAPSRRRRQSGGISQGRLGNRNNNNTGGTGLLATIRNALPARFREYGILNPDSRTFSGRRNDGTTDHGDEDDEDEDEWIAPPPSMPGIYGGGVNNDGVFANMAAKPGNNSRGDRTDVVGGDDELPEKEIPPAYELAVLDAAPPYFDTTVHAPGLGGIGVTGGMGGGLEEILIEGLPLGNPFSFFWSLLVSMSFQFVGFLLTTLLSTSHAAKNGSRAGLGVTLIQYGLFLANDNGEGIYAPPDDGHANEAGKDEWAAFWGNGGDNTAAAATPTGAVARMAVRAVASGAASLLQNGTSTEDEWRQPVLLDGGMAISGVASSWLSMVLMIGGWFLLISSLTSYLKAIRYAKALRDGVSTNADSWLERGGPIGAIYTRFTGRDFPGTTTERTWGLAPRPAPRPTEPSGTSAQPPPPPPDSRTRPLVRSLVNPDVTGVRSI